MKFSFEDVVLRLRKRTVSVGIVSETVEDAPDVSDEEDDEDEEGFAKLRDGQCRVAWLPRGVETVEAEDKLVLGDKSLMPGDVVEFRSAPGRKGFCLNVRVKAVVRPLLPQRGGEPFFILNVAGHRLAPLLQFAEGYAVTYGTWVGIIRHVSPRVYVRVDCPWDHKGERLCWLPERAAVNFDEIGGPTDDQEEYELETCAFRPGMRLIGPFKSVTSNATWVTQPPPQPPVIANKKRGKNLKLREVIMMVYDVRVDFVTINWSHTAAGLDAKKPPVKITGEELSELKMLHVYEAASLQVGRLKRYVVRPDDKIVTAGEWSEMLRQKVAKGAEDLSSGDGNNNAASAPVRNPTQAARKISRKGANSGRALLPSRKLAPSSSKEGGTGNSSGWSTEDKWEDNSDEDGDEEEEEEEEEGEEELEEGKESEGGAALGKKKSSHAALGATSSSAKKRKLRSRPNPRGGAKHPADVPPVVKETKVSTCEPGDVVVVEAVFTETEADIQWQDEEITENVRSNDLVPIEHLDDHEFFPGDFVWPSEGPIPGGFGFVKSVDHDQRTAKVAWFKYGPPESATVAGAGEGADTDGQASAAPPSKLNEIVVEQTGIEEISVYDLQEDSQFDFHLGTVVMLKTDDHLDPSEAAPKATVGQIVGFEEDGRLKIRWGNGQTGSQWPFMLRRIGDYDSDDGELWGRGDGHGSCCSSSSSSSCSSSERGDNDADAADLGDAPEDDGDDAWMTASESSADEEVDETAPGDEAGADDWYDASEDPDDPGTALVPIKTLPADVMALDYAGTKEDPPSYRIIRKKYIQKVKILERIRERIWTELNKYPADSEPHAFKHASSTLLAAVCKDCLLLDELMSTRHFRQKSIDWSAFPRVKRAMNPMVLDKTSPRIPEMVKLLSLATSLGDVGDKLVLDTSKLRRREREEFAVLFSESNSGTRLNFSTATEEERRMALAVAAAVVIDMGEGGAAQTVANISNQLANMAAQGGDITAALLDKVPSELMCMMHAWLRDRLFQASLAIVTEFGSNWVMDMELFYPNVGAEAEVDVGANDAGASAMDSASSSVMSVGGVVANQSVQPSVESMDMSELDKSVTSPQPIIERGSFEAVESTPASHKFAESFAATPGPEFNRAVMREMKLLRTSLPKGIHVRAFEDRRDLLSAMIEGPVGTPYEGGLFFFDCQLPSGYPMNPPRVLYISYVTDRLNPNLYEEGKVCVSLLGTWDGRGSELWTRDSSLLQVLVSIQGLILNKEPYYNEAGYERQRGERLAAENSRKYNEMAVVKVVQAMSQLMSRELPPVFADDIIVFLKKHGWKTAERFKKWIAQTDGDEEQQPEYPLVPLSRGFILCMEKALKEYEKGLVRLGISSSPDA